MGLEIFEFQEGELPFLFSLPHSGTEVPAGILDRMTTAGRELRDTDWYLQRLYDFPELDRVSRIEALWSRYVVDLNRSTDGENLYPGQPTTAVCPLTTFRGDAIYREGEGPSDTEIQDRIEQYWRPYHDQIDR